MSSPANERVFYGWWVVAACFVIAAFSWALGLFGSSIYLRSVTVAHGWPIAEVASAITLLFLTSALVQRSVARSIERWGPRPVLLTGTASMTIAVALIGQVTESWQLYPCFLLLGIGWSTLSTTGITTTVTPWFERHQGRSMTLAIMGASVGAIAGVPLLLLAIAKFGFSGGLIVAALVSGIVLAPLICIVFRYRGPGDLGQPRDGGLPLGSVGSTSVALPIANSLNRRRLLWSASCAFALALTVQIGFITHHIAVAAPLLGTTAAGLLVSATGLAAFVGRLVLARIVDGVSVRRLACLVMIAQTASLLAISFWPLTPVLVTASLVYGYGIGHITTLGPVVVRREFGAAEFGAAYGSAATVIQLTSAFGPALFGFLHDGFGGYSQVLLIAAAVTSIGCLSLYLGDPAKNNCEQPS